MTPLAVSLPRRVARRSAFSAGLLVMSASCSLTQGPQGPQDSRPASTAGTTIANVVLVGDSLAEQTAAYLQPLISDKALVAQYFGGTAPCDWLGRDLATSATSVAVISFAGNSLTPCMADGVGGFLHGQALVDKYRADVGALVEQVRATGAPVLLVGQPQRTGGAEVDLEVAGINQAYADLLEPPAVTFVDAGAAVEDANGQYATQLPCLPGEAECGPDGNNVVRNEDGVHFCPVVGPNPCPVYASGAFRFASAIATAVNAL